MESITKRRRFQPPITTFFDSHSDDDSTAGQTLNASSSSSCAFPVLPNSTQSSLLTVGCRIRKSVPEGYKTHTTPSGGFTPRPFMSARLSPELLAAINAPTKYSELTPYATTADSQSSIHDIGGLPTAIQPLSTATFCGISLRHMPPSSSSPLSPSTTQDSLTTNQNKRAFFDSSSDGEDDDVDADFIPQLPPSLFSGYLPSPSPSPYHQHHHHRRGSSYPFKHTTMPDLNALSASTSTSTSTSTNPAYRKFALPKSRVRTHPHPLPQEPASPEQENFGFFGPNFGGGCGYEVKLESASSGDFGEAEWLRQRHEVEMDCS